MGITINSPGIVVIHFFNKDEQARKLFEHTISREELGLQKLLEQDDLSVYGNEENNYWLDWVKIQNSNLVRLILTNDGPYHENKWNDLRILVNITTDNINHQPNFDIPSRTSFLYWGLINPDDVNNLENNDIAEMLAVRNDLLTGPYQLTWGLLWHLNVKEYPKTSEYIFLCKEPLVENAKREFLLSRNSGFLRLELHSFRAFEHINSYDQIGRPMLELGAELEENSSALLEVSGVKSLDVRQNALRQVTVSYGKLMKMLSEVRKLSTGLRADIERYHTHLESILVNAKDDVDTFLKHFNLRLRQIEVDMDYCDATAKGVETSISILRAQLETDSVRREGLIVTVISILAAIIAVGEVAGELTHDWKVVALAITAVIIACLVGWFIWLLFKRIKRKR